jgi:hypothetical protein
MEPDNIQSTIQVGTGSEPSVTEGGVNEDIALALLKRADLPSEDIERLTKDAVALKSRKVRFALAAHRHTPRRIALRLLREFYTFDLMRFALFPAAPPDLKRLADELLVTRLPSITLGERITLARRGSGLISAALLSDKESRIWQTALENPRVTEILVIRALQRPEASSAFVRAICVHNKWSLRSEIRMTLLRNPHTPLARVLEFARSLPPPRLRDVLHDSRLPEKTKAYLQKELESRKSRTGT